MAAARSNSTDRQTIHACTGKDPRHIHLTECTQRGSLDPRFASLPLLLLLHFNRNGHRTREQFVAPHLAVHRHGWVYRPEPIVCLVLEGHKSIKRGWGRERKPTVTVGVEYECANWRIRASDHGPADEDCSLRNVCGCWVIRAPVARRRSGCTGPPLFCALQETPSTPGGGGVPDAVAVIGVFFVVT